MYPITEQSVKIRARCFLSIRGACPETSSLALEGFLSEIGFSGVKLFRAYLDEEDIFYTQVEVTMAEKLLLQPIIFRGRFLHIQYDEKRLESIEIGNSQDDNFGPQSCKIFVGGITNDMDSNVLKAYFSNFGKVVTVTIAYNMAKRKSRGFAFVIFKQSLAVDSVIQNYYYNFINEQWIDCKKAVSREGMIDHIDKNQVFGSDLKSTPPHQQIMKLRKHSNNSKRVGSRNELNWLGNLKGGNYPNIRDFIEIQKVVTHTKTSKIHQRYSSVQNKELERDILHSHLPTPVIYPDIIQAQVLGYIENSSVAQTQRRMCRGNNIPPSLLDQNPIVRVGSWDLEFEGAKESPLKVSEIIGTSGYYKFDWVQYSCWLFKSDVQMSLEQCKNRWVVISGELCENLHIRQSNYKGNIPRSRGSAWPIRQTH